MKAHKVGTNPTNAKDHMANKQMNKRSPMK